MQPAANNVPTDIAALDGELSHLAEGDPKWNNSSTAASLRALHDAKVSIIDWNAPPKVFIRETPNGDGDEFQVVSARWDALGGFNGDWHDEKGPSATLIDKRDKMFKARFVGGFLPEVSDMDTSIIV